MNPNQPEISVDQQNKTTDREQKIATQKKKIISDGHEPEKSACYRATEGISFRICVEANSAECELQILCEAAGGV